jgi:predicted metalloprotease with PDZ domain
MEVEMRTQPRRSAWYVAFLVAASVGYAPALAQPRTVKLAFTVSMEQPATHVYHVVFRCEGLPGPTQDFKMPVWSPGYYTVLDFPENVRNFHAEDDAGLALEWEKASSNRWRVRTGGAPVVAVSYDVFAPIEFVANPYLGEDRGLIIGTGVFMHVEGMISQPVTVKIELNPKWSAIATSLDPVASIDQHVFAAPDFDILYDSPVLMGNLESLPSFEVNGVPHYFVGHDVGTDFDRHRFMEDLKAVVEQGIAVIGEIPYPRYVFLGIGSGRGGIEHLNSAAVSFSGGPSLETREGRIRTLSFLAHEYFHNYNVKRIRPVALGPFDYDKPNVTNMLWVSEGFSVYYEYLMVARAGLMNQRELLAAFGKDIAAYENSTGHLFQSVTRSSRDTWTQGPFGGRGGSGISKTISYYNKGSALGLLLDLKIRHETKNRKSLDTVMQTLYRKFYKALNRGWTDEEFRAVCEATAGTSLAEVFDYASTTKDIDYGKYLRYAGLELEKAATLPDAYLGAIAEDVDGRLVVAAVEPASPAARAHVAVKDEIRTVDGKKADAQALNATLSSKKPDDTLRLKLARTGRNLQLDVVLGHKMQRSFTIVPIARPTALQSALLRGLMTPRR